MPSPLTQERQGIRSTTSKRFLISTHLHCLQAPKGDPPPHLLDLGLLGSHISGQSWNFFKVPTLGGLGRF